MDEVEPGELRVGPGDQEMPGHRDRQEEGDPGGGEGETDQPPVPPIPPVPGGEHPDAQNHPGDDDPDQPLGQGGEGGGGVEDPDPQPAFPGVFGAGGEEESEERHGQERGDRHVQGDRLAEAEPERGGGEDDPRPEPRPPAVEAAPGDIDGEDAQKREESGSEAERPLLRPEEAERRRLEPVEEGRLLEVLDPVQARRHPVAGRHHLPRDLGIAPLVRRPQGPPAEVRAVEEGHPEDEEEEVAPEEARGGGRRAWGRERFFHGAGAAYCIARPAVLPCNPARRDDLLPPYAAQKPHPPLLPSGDR